MRIRLSFTLDITPTLKPYEDIETELGSSSDTAKPYKGPAIGFRRPDTEPDDAHERKAHDSTSR